MADRAVTAVQRDLDGDIIAICNPYAPWSPRTRAQAVLDIELGIHTYHVPWTNGQRTPIHVVNGMAGKYLRTDRDNTVRNNLDELPEG